MSTETYGSYQLLKRLATGGMAQIYLARQRGPEGFEKLLVVKRILPHLAENDDFITMFLDEARIAARLNHPNVVQIYNLGAQDDSYFIAMEYIHGEDVRRVWKRSVEADKPLPVPLACRVVIDAAAGLDYAHKKTDSANKPLNIVHRDVSPQNILVTFDGGVKVVDFGIAKAADQATVTRSGVLKGKYSYMSPEQAAGQRVDCRADVFALGVVLYELLTGVRLFKRPTDMQTLQAVAECQITPPSKLSDRVPASLDPIVMKALAKTPNERYSDALQLQLGLEEWLSENRQPSSTAHLAAFMKDIFAERLAEEARLGEVVPSEAPHPTGVRTAAETPSRRSGAHGSVARRQTPPPAPPVPSAPRVSRGVELRQQPERRTGTMGAVRRTPKPAVAAPPPPEESNAKRWGVAGVVALAFALAVGGGLWLALRPGPAPTAPDAPPGVRTTASVRLMTQPPGATVIFNGGALGGVTPLTLPRVPAGRYPVVVALDGYEELQTVVDIPASGAVALETLKLVPVKAAQPETPKAPAQVQLTLEARPAEAALTVDGVTRGRSPVVVTAVAGSELDVRVEAAKYRPASRKVKVGEGPSQTERIVLDAIPEPVVTRPEPRQDPRPVEPKTEPRPPAQEGRKAMVRFAVTPWAEVSCGGRSLGTTPFPDVSLPVGVYECRFSNPELGRTKTLRVEVKASGANTVVVKF
ncbi:serine/threonine protein kinase [Myxococcaceae bacterium GXIMD 01537]